MQTKELSNGIIGSLHCVIHSDKSQSLEIRLRLAFYSSKTSKKRQKISNIAIMLKADTTHMPIFAEQRVLFYLLLIEVGTVNPEKHHSAISPAYTTYSPEVGCK